MLEISSGILDMVSIAAMLWSANREKLLRLRFDGGEEGRSEVERESRHLENDLHRLLVQIESKTRYSA
jgi:hypothetical protein